VPLFYLAPLPILIAAMGWSHWAALIASFVASAGLAAVFGGFFFVTFLIGVALPAWWLGYLALLARPTPAVPGGMEWYPAGHLVLWAALIAAGIVTGAMLSLGGDLDGFRSSLRNGLERMLKMPARTTANDAEPSRLLDFLVIVLPPAAAVLTTPHQCDQSLARRAHREDLRATAAAVVPICRPCGFRPTRRR